MNVDKKYLKKVKIYENKQNIIKIYQIFYLIMSY